MLFNKYRCLAWVCACLLVYRSAAADEREFSLSDLRAKLAATDSLVFGDKDACASIKQSIAQTEEFVPLMPSAKSEQYEPALYGKYTLNCPKADLGRVPGYNMVGHHESFLDRHPHGAFALYEINLDEPGKSAILLFGKRYMTDEQWKTFGGAKDFPANLPQAVNADDSYSILKPGICEAYQTGGARTVGQFSVTKDQNGVFRAGNVNYVIDAYTDEYGKTVAIFKIAYDKFLGAETKPFCSFQRN